MLSKMPSVSRRTYAHHRGHRNTAIDRQTMPRIVPLVVRQEIDSTRPRSLFIRASFAQGVHDLADDGTGTLTTGTLQTPTPAFNVFYVSKKCWAVCYSACSRARHRRQATHSLPAARRLQATHRLHAAGGALRLEPTTTTCRPRRQRLNGSSPLPRSLHQYTHAR